jgi:hypothetical protein
MLLTSEDFAAGAYDVILQLEDVFSQSLDFFTYGLIGFACDSYVIGGAIVYSSCYMVASIAIALCWHLIASVAVDSWQMLSVAIHSWSVMVSVTIDFWHSMAVVAINL